jgi:5-hydroxyisourate hydrolase-like protein (transthyretin family)
LFSIASAVASDANETTVFSEYQSDEIISVENENIISKENNDMSSMEDTGKIDSYYETNKLHSKTNNENNELNDINTNDDAEIKINSNSINVNSTKKGEIHIINITNGVDTYDFSKENLNITVTYNDGNETKNITVTEWELVNRTVIFTLENGNFTTANLNIKYTGIVNATKDINLNRIYNVQIVAANTVNEYQDGNFTFKVTDVDDNTTSLKGKKLSLLLRGSISVGHSATIDENGIASFKTANLYIFDQSGGTLSMKQLEVGSYSVEMSTSGALKSEKLTTNITVIKANIKIEIDPYKEYYGDDNKVTIHVTNVNSGLPVPGIILKLYMPQLTYQTYYVQTDANGTGRISAKNLVGGDYDLTVSNNDTINMNYCSASSVITVLQEPMNITVRNVTYNNDVIIEVELQDSVSGIISTSILNQTFYSNVENRKGSITIPNLAAGVYSIHIDFVNNVSRTGCGAFFEVYKMVPTIKIEYDDVNVNGLFTINIIQPEDLTGEFTVNFNGRNYTSEITDGYVEFNIDDLEVDTYRITLFYSGNTNYTSCNLTDEINVLPLENPHLDLIINNVVEGEDLVVRPSVVSDATGTFDIYVDGEYEYSMDVGDEYILEPEMGEHEIEIIYSGDDNFESVSLTRIFKVFSFYPIESYDTRIVYGSDEHFQATFYDEYGELLVNKYVMFNVNGTFYSTQTDSNGVAILDKDLEIGYYRIMIINPIANENRTNYLLIFSTIESNDVYTVNNTDFEFNVIFLDDFGDKLVNVPVLFKINGEDKVVWTNDDGVASLKLNLNIGIYDIISINTVTNDNKTNKLFVKSSSTGKYTYDIDEKDIVIPTLPSSASGTVTVKLPSDATGTVTLSIGGKDYKFDVVNGVANVKVPDLANAAYSYSITYSGDSKYSSFTKTGKVTVNKPAPKPVTKTTLTLKKVKVKRSAKKLVIQATLKINGKAVKGKVIKFKFNKKSYKAKTNAKGVAKITIKKSVLKKLKKGKKVTYTATYSKVTKKVTVKVKK